MAISHKSNSYVMMTIYGVIVVQATFNWILSSHNAGVWLNTVGFFFFFFFYEETNFHYKIYNLEFNITLVLFAVNR